MGDLKHSRFPIRFGEYRTSDTLQTIFCHAVWDVSGTARTCLHTKDVTILSERCVFPFSCHVRLLWSAILARGRCGCLHSHLCRVAIGLEMFCTANADRFAVCTRDNRVGIRTRGGLQELLLSATNTNTFRNRTLWGSQHCGFFFFFCGGEDESSTHTTSFTMQTVHYESTQLKTVVTLNLM